jgi:uncharacterized membrane protein YccF (DUF307 family)
MNLLGNVIWTLFGGLLTCVGYVFGGFLLCLTVIGIPFGLQLFKLAPAVLMPFRKEVVDTPANTGVLRLVLNILWILCGGIWLAAGTCLWVLSFLLPSSGYRLRGSTLSWWK